MENTMSTHTYIYRSEHIAYHNEHIVYSIFVGNQRGTDTTRIELDDLESAITNARTLVREGFSIVTIEPYLVRSGEIAGWSPFTRDYAEHNGRVVVSAIDSKCEYFPGRVLLDWVALLPELFLDDSLSSTLVLDRNYEDGMLFSMAHLVGNEDRKGYVVFGVTHNYQYTDSSLKGPKYTRYLRGKLTPMQVDMELAALQAVYDDLRWNGNQEDAVFVDLATEYLKQNFDLDEITNDVFDISFVVDLHWNWEQCVCDWNLKDEIKGCITPSKVSVLLQVLDVPFNPLSSMCRLERQLMANGVVPFRWLESPHYIELKE